MPRSCTRVALAVLFAAAISSAQRGAPVPQQLVFTPYHATGIYDIGDTVGWTVTPGPVEPTYSYKWTARRNNAVVLKEGKLDLSSGQDEIEVTGDAPEMIYVAIEPVAKEPLPMIESEHNNLTPRKEQNWDARSKELLEILLYGGEFKPAQ